LFLFAYKRCFIKAVGQQVSYANICRKASFRQSTFHRSILDFSCSFNHFCYIKKIENFVSSFKCSRCSKLWSNSTACHCHEKTCIDFCKHEFIGGYCEKTKSVFENLPKKYQDRKFFDYYITYDFESILSKIEDVRTDRLQYTNKHLPVSFSLFSNIPGYDKEPIFVCHNNVKELIDMFVENLVNMSAKAYTLNKVKYADVIKYLECQIHFAKHEKDKIKAEKQLLTSTHTCTWCGKKFSGNGYSLQFYIGCSKLDSDDVKTYYSMGLLTNWGVGWFCSLKCCNEKHK
jgi:hypothetical protein